MLPPVDADPRAILVDRMLDGNQSQDDVVRGEYRPVASWARTPMEIVRRQVTADAVEIVLHAAGLEKTLHFSPGGALHASWRWDRAAHPADARFAPELSLAREPALELAPGADVWRYPIQTVAKSERGLEKTDQGIAIMPLWPVTLGEAWLRIE